MVETEFKSRQSTCHTSISQCGLGILPIIHLDDNEGAEGNTLGSRAIQEVGDRDRDREKEWNKERKNKVWLTNVALPCTNISVKGSVD